MVEAELLHDLEKKVLLTLQDMGHTSQADIIREKSGLREDDVNRAIEWLKGKELISVTELFKQKVRSTQLGKKCMEQGMPEKRFLTTLKKQPLSIPELRKEAGLDNNEFNASIGFLKAEGYISVDKGKISLTEKGKKRLEWPWKEDDFFPMVETWKYVEEIPLGIREVIPFLKSRGLVEEEATTIKTISTTEIGKKIIPKITFEETIDMLTPKIISEKSWKNKKFRKYEINAPSPAIHSGKKQPYLKFVEELKNKLVALGFEETKGPFVETEFFNNDVLFMPQDHPAREIHDMFTLKQPKKGNLSNYKKLLENVKAVHETGGKTGSIGWRYKFDIEKSAQLMLRSQTTAVSARTLNSKNLQIPGKYFTIDRNFRVDVIDWKHLAEFDQIDGIILDSNITFVELLGMLKMFAIEVGGAAKFKFAPSYFPFTEPSVELHIFVEGKGWVEIGGAGVLRPEVTEPFGIKVPVIAWGLSPMRLYMNKYKITDIRDLFSQNLKYLREFK